MFAWRFIFVRFLKVFVLFLLVFTCFLTIFLLIFHQKQAFFCNIIAKNGIYCHFATNCHHLQPPYSQQVITAVAILQ